MALSTDWIQVEGDEKLSHAERLGFSKAQIDSFIKGQFIQDTEKQNMQKEIDELI